MTIFGLGSSILLGMATSDILIINSLSAISTFFVDYLFLISFIDRNKL